MGAGLFLAGCTGSPRALESRPTGPAGTLTPELAAQLVRAGGLGDVTLSFVRPFAKDAARAALLALGPTGLAPARRRDDGEAGSHDLDPPPCAPVVSGDTADADQDGIPKAASYVVRCEIHEPYPARVDGAYTLSDADDAKAFPLAGLVLHVPRYEMVVTLSPGETYTYATQGSYEVAARGGLVTTSASLVRTVNGPQGLDAVRIFVDTTVTPDAASAPERSGRAQAHGFLAVDAGGVSYVLELAATGLGYSRACENQGLSDGRLVLRDGTGHAVTYDYAACSARRALDGAPLE